MPVRSMRWAFSAFGRRRTTLSNLPLSRSHGVEWRLQARNYCAKESTATTPPKKPILAPLLFVGGFFGFVGILELYKRYRASQTQIVEDGPSPEELAEGMGGRFTMLDQNGKLVTEQAFMGKYLLLYFGFTRCPDICPQALSKMTGIVKELDKRRPKGPEVTPVFVTMDPARDPPKEVKAYLAEYHPRFVGLTGSDEQVDVMAKNYRAYRYVNEDTTGNNEYLIDHSMYCYLVGPDGNAIRFFSFSTSGEDIIDYIDQALDGKAS